MFFCVASRAASFETPVRSSNKSEATFYDIAFPLRSWLSKWFYPFPPGHSTFPLLLAPLILPHRVYHHIYRDYTINHTRENRLSIIVDRVQHCCERDFVYTTPTTTTQCSHKVPREITALRTPPREADREQRIRTSKHKRARAHTYV